MNENMNIITCQPCHEELNLYLKQWMMQNITCEISTYAWNDALTIPTCS